MKPAGHMTKGLQIQNESPKVHAAYLMSEPHLKIRKIIRHCRKKKHGKNLGKEGLTYKAGGF